MGYGFDLWEWASESQLQGWHNYMHAHMGWSHYLGARSQKNELSQLYEGMDYSSYEQHRPDYNKYVETIEARPSKPSFSEDRFRVRDEGRDKDYNMEDTRRGLWDSTMAGGIANIWGHLLNSPSSGAPSGGEASGPYPKPEWIKTWAEFFDGRFLRDMVRANSITNGVCLKHPNNTQFVFYKESTSSIQMNLTTMSGAQRAVAVDAKLPYLEIDMGKLTASEHTWIAPYDSDWAIAVGEFRQNLNPPVAPTNLRLVQ